MTSFTSTLDSLVEADGAFVVSPDENWFQGRTVFGGLVAALSLETARRTIPELPPLRTAQIAFVGPASGPLRISAALMRAGRSASFVAVDVTCEAKLATRAFFTFAEARKSQHRFDRLTMPSAPPPEKGAALFNMKGAPRSTSNFEGRLVGGEIPFTAALNPELLLWLRHRDEAAAGSEAGLLALADASPPAVFPMFAAPAPISTMNWTVDFPGSCSESDGWHLVHTSGDLVGDGYSVQSTTIWNRSGSPVIIARQLVALYD